MKSSRSSPQDAQAGSALSAGESWGPPLLKRVASRGSSAAVSARTFDLAVHLSMLWHTHLWAGSNVCHLIETEEV